MTSVREEISKNFHYYRKKSGFTQKQIADLLGVRNTAISNWEKGINSIDIDTLAKACSIFKVSINDIFGNFSNGNTSSFNLTEKEKRLVTAYRNKPEMQSSVDKLLDIEESEANSKEKIS